MPKLIIFVGRHIHAALPLTPDRLTLVFPELGKPDSTGQRWPLHAQDTVDFVRAEFIAQAARSIESKAMMVTTQAQCVVAVAAELVGQGVFSPSDVEITMFEVGDDLQTATTYHINEKGVLTGGWPFGWFEWT